MKMGTDTIGYINYFIFSTDGCSPWMVTHSIPTTMRTNFVQAPVDMTIHDLRGKETSVNLDTNALEVMNYNGSIQEEFEDGSEAQQRYFEEISDLLKKRLGALRVIIYHHTFRSRDAPRPDEQCDHTHRNPIFFPHVDTNRFGIPELLEEHLKSGECEMMKKNRIQIINVWRPLGPNPITENPLAICDYRSIDINNDVHELTIRGAGSHSKAYTLSCNANDAHKWYYLSRICSNEMLVFKIFDSKPDVAQFAFHTAFENDTKSTMPILKQQSLELRCLVLYDQ